MTGRVAAALYLLLAPRRRILLAVSLAVLVAGGVLAWRAPLESDIGALLPDDASDTARDLDTVRRSPLGRTVALTLTSAPGANPALLDEAEARFVAALDSALLRDPRGDRPPDPAALAAALPDLLPALLAPGDLAELEERTSPAGVRLALESLRARLIGPEGWGAGEAAARDPLDLATIVRRKLGSLAVVPRARLAGRGLRTADGTGALILADTPVGITDADGSRRLEAAVERARLALPPGVTLDWVSGHRYTLANAAAVTRDLALILGLSSLAILAIYVIFLRSRWAFFVFLVPVSVMAISIGCLGVVDPPVFAVTVGFAGVLLGMADEFAMHVFVALRRGGAPPERILAEVARPVFYGGVATAAAFGVMLTSALPGQRQLGALSLMGIVLSVVISLVVLPHLVRPAPAAPAAAPASIRSPRPRRRWPILVPWILVLAVSVVGVGRMRVNGDLGALNLVSPELAAAEKRLKGTWGDVRGRAMVVASGRTMAEALERNEQAADLLLLRLAPGEVVTIAPLLPSPRRLEENRRRWATFWEGRLAGVRTALAAEGKRLGFAPGAFDPFLAAAAAPARIDPGTVLRQAGFGPLLEALLGNSPEGPELLTLVPDTPRSAALLGSRGSLPGVRLVAQSRISATVGGAIAREFLRYLLGATLVIVLTLVLAFRDVRRVLLALVPVATGMVVMVGVMGWLGLSFNLSNIVATVLIIGLCVDYGIFMTHRLEGETDRATARAVLISGLTTLAGFGVLVLARHPALHSIGTTVLLGFGAAIPAAILVVPALDGGGR